VSFNSLPVRDGTVDTGEEARLSVATDFGHLVRRVPGAVVRPGSVNDVVAVVGWAAERGVPFIARGAGHSMGGQAQLEGGIVVDLTTLRQVHSVDAHRLSGADGRRHAVGRRCRRHVLFGTGRRPTTCWHWMW
jgi:FAD/FMN-containing dehydrogenase